MTVKYIDIPETVIKERLLDWQKHGLQYTATGYGKKIPTTKVAQVDGRWYRIYCRIFSNIGTCYIVKGGEELVVRET